MKRLVVAGCALFAAIAAAEDEPLSPPKNARHDKWRVLGMGGGGTTQIPLVSPHDPKTVVCACDMTGAYITRDGGANWRMFNLRTGVGAFAFDPLKPNVIYAGNVGLWRSEDNGDTWSLIWPDPKKTTEYWRDDHGEYILSSEDPLYSKSTDESIETIFVRRKWGDKPNEIFFVFHGSLFGSDDDGKTFQQLCTGVSNSRAIVDGGNGFAIVCDSQTKFLEDPTKVFAAMDWMTRAGPFGGRVLSANFGTEQDKGDRTLIYVTAPTTWQKENVDEMDVVKENRVPKILGGIQGSEDYGRTWLPLSANLIEKLYKPGNGDPPQFPSIACTHPGRNCTTYVSFTGLRLGDGPKEIYNGLAKSTDSGEKWKIVFQESNKPASNLMSSWIEPRMVQGNPNLWFDTARGLAVAPTNPDIVYATDCFRAYRTTDGGKNWRQMNSFHVGDVKENRWTSRGLDVTNCYGLHWDPFNKEHVFLTQTDMGLIQSSDGGDSWQCASTGIPDHWRNTMYWMELDPKVPDLMWGACSYAHDLPREKMWRHQDTDNFEGGVCVSTDGGHNWKLSNEGMPQTACTHILLDPTSPVGARTLYACGFGRGVFKSIDNGKTWSLKNAGIEKQKPLAWRITRAADGTLYLTVARRAMKKPLGDPGDGALYKSTDGAEHWVKLPLPEGTSFPMTVTVDPNDIQRLYLSMWGTFSMDGDTAGGAYVSTDGGLSWKHLFKDGPHTYELTVDPKNSKTLYVTGFNSAAWRSVDQGETWKRIKGFNFKYGHRVIVDPFHDDKIFITTFGGGLWHGPAEGDPDAVEDILTPLKRK